MGGGGEPGKSAPPQAESDALSVTAGAPTVSARAAEESMPAATPAPEPQMLMLEAPAENVTASAVMTLTQPVAAVEEAQHDTEFMTASAPIAEVSPQRPAPFPPPWITVTLGVVTLLLAGTTLWLWRRD
jgi:hypothetical protein